MAQGKTLMTLSRVGLAMLCLVASSSELRGDSYQERRMRAGTRLFRALLAADRDLEAKVDDDGQLLILFFYQGDRRQAQELAEEAFRVSASAAPPRVRDLPVRVVLVDDPALSDYQSKPPAGIFLASSPGDRDLATIIRFAVAHHVVLFSPFEGHVEQGVLGGLVIEAQVLPYVNLTTARESGISLKQFFLRVAKVAG